MKIKIGIISLVSCFLLPTKACAVWQNGWLDNWLVGVSGGYATRKATIESSIETAELNLVSYSRDSSDNGWLGAVFGGYQAIFENWLVGGEFNLEWQDIENSHSYAFDNHRVTAEYRRKGCLDFSGRLGYALSSNLLPYLRLGVELSRDSLASSFAGPLLSEAILYNKAWIHRFLVGIGAEVPIPDTCGVTVRLEFDYHSKGKTIQDYGLSGLGLDALQYYTGMQPRTYSGRLSVVWNFFED